MLKNILGLVLTIMLTQALMAQKSDTTTFYFQKLGRQVGVLDSADFYRIILPPDPKIDKDLYRAFDYYPSGKLLSTVNSFTNDVHLIPDGFYTSYFENGKRQSIAQFKNGRRVGTITNYYPSGKLYDILKVEDLTYFFNSWYYDSYFLGRYPNRMNIRLLKCAILTEQY